MTISSHMKKFQHIESAHYSHFIIVIYIMHLCLDGRGLYTPAYASLSPKIDCNHGLTAWLRYQFWILLSTWYRCFDEIHKFQRFHFDFRF